MDFEESFCSIKRPTIPSVGSDDEESFVVLGNSSLTEEDLDGPLSDEVIPPIRSGKVHEMQNLLKMEISQINNSPALPEMPSAADPINVASTSLANFALSPESSYEEIQKKVEEVIRENEKLKNIIAQNNLSMKSQYDKILAWKDDVNKITKSYKDKLIEAKNYITKCKEENTKLANDVEKYKKIKELQDEEIMILKSKEKKIHNTESLFNSAEQNIIEFDLQVAKAKIEELQTTLAEVNIEKAELMEKNEKLTEKLVTTQSTNENNEQTMRITAEIHNLNKALEFERTEKMKLIAEIKTLTEKLVKTPDADELLQAKDQEIKELQMAHEASNEQIIRLKNEIDHLKTEKQQNKLTHLNISLDESKLKSYEEKINQLERENYSLKEKIASLKYSLGEREALEERTCHLNEQLIKTQKAVTALEEERNRKVKEIEELRQLLQSNSKNDEIFALNAQLTLYKNDFEAERESKDAIKRERDQIAEDLKNLQKRNKQLQHEIETIRERTAQPSKPDGFVCPKCSFGFNNYQSLENHVHRCLDLDSFP